jgi:hypothetical protein
MIRSSGEMLDIELRALLDRLAVERVQDGVAGAVGRGAGALHRRAFAIFGGVAAERALIDLALLGARERHAVMLELIDRLGRLAGEVFHGVGVAEPVRPLHGVVHVPLPAVGPHIAERRRDAALRRDGVGAGREHLGHAGRAQPLLGHAERGAQAGAAGAHDHHVIGVIDRIKAAAGVPDEMADAAKQVMHQCPCVAKQHQPAQQRAEDAIDPIEIVWSRGGCDQPPGDQDGSRIQRHAGQPVQDGHHHGRNLLVDAQVRR